MIIYDISELQNIERTTIGIIAKLKKINYIKLCITISLLQWTNHSLKRYKLVDIVYHNHININCILHFDFATLQRYKIKILNSYRNLKLILMKCICLKKFRALTSV